MNETKSNNKSEILTLQDAADLSIRSAVRMGAEVLKASNIDNSDYDSFALLSDINGMSRSEYLIHGDNKLTNEQLNIFQDYLRKRAMHIPLQHIIGKAYFYGYEFKVNSDVLIPRPDTEILIEEVLKVTSEQSSVLDMCTGSGCIILTLASQNHVNSGVGADISEKALLVANENKAKLNVKCVDFLQSDLFENIDKMKFDVIVSNPPYIRSDVIPTLSEEVKDHDPMLALDGFEDGLHFYREITKKAKFHINSGGWLCYEIGYDQASDVSEIMRINGYTDITVVKDLSGLDRVVKGRLI